MRVVVFLIVSALACPAQTQEAATFRTGAALVRVDVQVMSGGRPVGGLDAGDFVLREEGAERRPDFFGRESEPLEVMVVLDVSGSMGDMLRQMAEAGRQALAKLAAGDRVGVAFFARRLSIAEELTEDKALIERVLREAPLPKDLGAGTSINDSLLALTDWWRLQPPFSGRRAIVILTDNGGVHYKAPDGMVVAALSELNIVLNAILPEDAKPPGPVGKPGEDVNRDFTPANVFHLAEQTGGEVMKTRKAGARFEEMLEHVRTRYTLAITPVKAPAGIFRRTEVTLSESTRRRYPKAVVRARAGYRTP
jgi:VWFA-related protein